MTTSVRTEGGLLPSDLLAKIAGVEPDVPGLSDAEFGLAPGERFREAITRSWNRLVGAWAALEAIRVTAEPTDPLTGATRERFLMPLLEELGFKPLPVARAVAIDGTSYPISHNWNDRVPVHLVGFGVELDARTKGVRGAAGAAPHALMQEYLNRADAALWGLVANGRTLRLLRDSTSLTRQAYVEFDLEAIFTGELYADFALLWSVCHRSRFDGERPTDCLLERWTKKAAEDGTRALDKLRGGVEKAIETLGGGFLAHPANGELREGLRSGGLDRQDYYRELLRLVYRLIFLFTAEDRRDESTGRELLLDPAATEHAVERYRRFYSTVRLRALAVRHRGTRHPDLWINLRRVMAALGGEGASTVALPSLGSFLFGMEACPHLDSADLRNADLLDAVRALATIEEDRRLRLVDYLNLGAEELGGIYEGLLELQPEMGLDATPPKFRLVTVAGNERKLTGSYYTHSDLISIVLESALEPAIEEAVAGKPPSEAEHSLLSIAVLDPAAGSGHFLVAAAHRMARRLARIRSSELEPPPSAVRDALRDVIARCIYAVDINPMAVELCKVSLWLEAVEPGKPMTFLDSHIKCGNSVIGTLPELVTMGIPDSAYDPLEGDDPRTARSLRDRNSRERSGQLGLFGAQATFDTAGLADVWGRLEAMADTSVANVRDKQIAYRTIVESPEATRQRTAADAWCAAFFALKQAHGYFLTTSAIQQATAGAGTGRRALEEAVADALRQVGVFQWPLEFPDVMARGGFDVVLGNPPWDTLSPDAKEFFAVYDPGVRNASPAEQKRIVSRLLSDVVIKEGWDSYCSRLYRTANFLRNSGRYRLFAPGNLGKGDFNVFRIFVELALQLVRPGGRVAQIVPDGLYLGANSTAIRKELIEAFEWTRLFGFANRGEIWFKGIYYRTKFCVYAARRLGATTELEVAFGLNSEEELRRVRAVGGTRLSVDALRELSPDTYALPDTADLESLALITQIQRRYPRFGVSVPGQPSAHYMSEISMGGDRDRFDERSGAAVYEGRMVDLFDHRAKAYVSGRGRTAVWRDLTFDDPEKAVLPQWRISPASIPAKVRPRLNVYRVGFCEVASPSNERTLVAALIPPGVVAGHTVPTIVLESGRPADYMLWLAAANSLVIDFVARRQVQLHLSRTILDGLPLPRRADVNDSATRQIVALAARLTCTAPEMNAFWDALASDGWVPARTGNSIPGLTTEDDRLIARCHLDALVAVHLYGLEIEALERVLLDFRALANRERRAFGEYRTQRLTLEDATVRDGASRNRTPTAVAERHPVTVGQTLGASARSRAELTPADLRQGSATSTRHTDCDWSPESEVDVADLLTGQRVRYRGRGEGTLLSVKPTRLGAELLIRFDAGGETWMVFGLGHLELEVC